MFQLKQSNFFLNASCVSCQAAVTSHHPVTGNNNGNLIVPHSAAYGLRRHTGSSLFDSKLSGNLPVGYGLSIGNLQ